MKNNNTDQPKKKRTNKKRQAALAHMEKVLAPTEQMRIFKLWEIAHDDTSTMPSGGTVFEITEHGYKVSRNKDVLTRAKNGKYIKQDDDWEFVPKWDAAPGLLD